jgi:hypothetical protein
MPAWPFRQVWAVDFVFAAPPGERPTPRCCVARELRTGQLVRCWLDGVRVPTPPYGTAADTLVVAHYASAEWGCHLALDWPMPLRGLDLYAEFAAHTSGRSSMCGNGLLGALVYFGLDAVAVIENPRLRALAQRGGPYTVAEQTALLDYCQSDVDAVARLLHAMHATIDLPRALLRGRYTVAVARMEWQGLPIDVPTLTHLRQHWDRVKTRLVATLDPHGHVYEQGTFRAERWANYLQRHGIPWPRGSCGALALDDETFRERARAFPNTVGPFRELRQSLSALRLTDLAVGADGRNRCSLAMFASTTGRNQPSTTKFIFGPATWLRGLIRPAPGRAIAYLDYAQQELALAAALSGDAAMQAAYQSGDFYLTFAQLAGAVPAHATKQTHGALREQFKTVALGVLYGLGPKGLAQKLGIPLDAGRHLLGLHRRTFPTFWAWSDRIETQALLLNRLCSVFGWPVHVGPDANPRSLRNFPMQANGAEMLRLACCLATEAGVAVCAPVHDALLIEADVVAITATVTQTQAMMADAAAVVLDGFRLRTDATIVADPERYRDPRGQRMWDVVLRLSAEVNPHSDAARNDTPFGPI